MLWESLTVSSVSREEQQSRRCKGSSAAGERHFLKIKGGFWVG